MIKGSYSFKKKPLSNDKGKLDRWCLHAELNHEFILTMDVYYHYTMQASALCLHIVPLNRKKIN